MYRTAIAKQHGVMFVERGQHQMSIAREAGLV